MSKKKKATTRPAKQPKQDAKVRCLPRISSKKPSQKNGDDLLGFMAGRFEIVGDIESPAEDWKYWDPEKNLRK